MPENLCMDVRWQTTTLGEQLAVLLKALPSATEDELLAVGLPSSGGYTTTRKWHSTIAVTVAQLEHMKSLLVQLNRMCLNATDTDDSRTPEAMMYFTTNVARTARTIELAIDRQLGDIQLVATRPPSRFRRLMEYIFPAIRICQ